MLKSNLIYSFEEFKALILKKMEIGSYFLACDDFYFEEVDENTNLIRDAFQAAGNNRRAFNVSKYIDIQFKDDYTTGEIQSLIKNLEQDTRIILTIFNQKKKNCFILFISNGNDEILERKINEVLRMEE